MCYCRKLQVHKNDFTCRWCFEIKLALVSLVLKMQKSLRKSCNLWKEQKTLMCIDSLTFSKSKYKNNVRFTNLFYGGTCLHLIKPETHFCHFSTFVLGCSCSIFCFCILLQHLPQQIYFTS